LERPTHDLLRVVGVDRARVDRGCGERLEVAGPVQARAGLGVVTIYNSVLCLLRAAVLNLDVGIVGRRQLRFLMRINGVGRTAVTDRGGMPVHVLELVLARTPVIDVHIYLRRISRRRYGPVCGAAGGDKRCLILALLLECPADNLVVRTAEYTLACPVECVRG